MTARFLRPVAAACLLVTIGAARAAAQITTGTAVQVSPPSNPTTGMFFGAQRPRIVFQPRTGQYAIVYWARNFQGNTLILEAWTGAFLTQDGVRIAGPLSLLEDPENLGNSLTSLLPFPTTDAVLSVYSYGDSLDSGLAFGNNVYVSDATGIGFSNNPLQAGPMADYTNNGGDKSLNNNCGQSEETGPSAVDSTHGLFFLSYVQDQNAYDNGSCTTPSSSFMGAYHQNANATTISSNPPITTSQFVSGPFTIDSSSSAFGHDAVFNPTTGQVWVAYSLGTQISFRRVTQSGVTGVRIDRPTTSFVSFARLAVNPNNGNVLAVWNDGTSIRSETFDKTGVSLGPAALSDASVSGLQALAVAATADTFVVVVVTNTSQFETHALGRVLTPNGQPAAEWARLDTGTDANGNPLQAITADLTVNTVRGSYGLSLGTNNGIVYFEEFTATAGEALTVTLAGTGVGSVTSAPAGINCPGTCSASFDPGTVVTLTETPASLTNFSGWSGACSSDPCTVTLSSPQSVTATFTKVQFAVTIVPTGNGTVTSSPSGITCPGTCAASFDGGSTVTLHGTADPGWRFAGFGAPCPAGAASCDVSLFGEETISATFVQQFALTAAPTGSGGGTVTSAPAGINCPGTCSATFDSGTVVTLTATPDATSRFDGWTGACSGSGVCPTTMSAAQSVTATFVRQFALTAATSGSGGGTVTSAPSGISCPGTCSAKFDSAAVVTLTATADATSRFAGWSGACSGTGACSVTMSVAASVTATFVRQFTLTAATAGSGGGAVTSAPAGINCPGTCSAAYDSGTPVTLTATPDSTSRFAGWSGACGGIGACTVSMSAAQSVTATFVRQFTLTVATAGSGAGAVTSAPVGINCPGTCAATFDSGTVVTLTAAPDSSSRSVLSGACSGTLACSVTMSTAQSVTATFTRQFPLTVFTAGSGGGGVTSAPTGITCTVLGFGTCTSSYDTGTVVTLTAAPDSSSRFAGWSGACSGTGPCTVTMSSTQSVVATFIRQVTLSIGGGFGTGSGTVTSAPAGIACGTTCTATFDQDTVVTLTATPDAGSSFAGWSGPLVFCLGPQCIVTMNTSMSVGASFNRITYHVGVSMAGSGGGSVVSVPVAIICPGTCAADFNVGSTVTLTATPDATSRFAGWSGACSGVGACTLSISAAQTVTATFVRQYPLTVTVGGNGAGTVTSTPGGLACASGSCSALFDAGTVVTLAAAPNATSTFGGWSGACAGTGGCSVTMTSAVGIGATFQVTIAGLSASVSALAPVIGAGSANSLTSTLAAAQASVARGNQTAAINQLNAFINQVQALVRSGRLDAVTGGTLISEAQILIAGL